MASNSLETYVTAAKASGLPMDQIERFVSAGYVAQPVQLPFHAACRLADEVGGPDFILFGGTRNSAKTHAVFAQMAIDDCQRYPGLKFLFLRNFRKAAGESFDDLSVRLLRHVSHTKTADQIEFPNGSRILIGGFKDQSDIDKYVGIEYDGVAIEEITLLTKEKIELLFGSIRTSRIDGWRVRKYATFNPGGVGYSYIKQIAVEPWRKKQETKTRFFYAHWKDNVFCDQDYIDYLNGLTGHLRKSWRDGDLDAFEGLAFPQWDEVKHVCAPFEIPETWALWRAVDYGYDPDPFSCHWYARDLVTGRVHIYRELYGVGYTDSIQARMINEMTPPSERDRIIATYAGADMFNTRVSAGIVSTNADEYLKHGVRLTRADTNRIGGKRKIDRVLGDLQDGRPGLVVFSSCVHFIRTVPFLVLKQGQEDIMDGQEDHAFDELRYGLTNYQDIKPPKRAENKQVKRSNAALIAWLNART
jgi:phage terminase large subunit